MGKELLFKVLRHEEAERVPWVPFAGVHAGKLKGYTAKEILEDADKLYESLMEKYSTINGIKRFDNEFFIQQKKEDKIYPWEKQPNQVSIHTFIRNQIHHRKDNRGC